MATAPMTTLKNIRKHGIVRIPNLVLGTDKESINLAPGESCRVLKSMLSRIRDVELVEVDEFGDIIDPTVVKREKQTAAKKAQREAEKAKQDAEAAAAKGTPPAK
jgi:hypothetical protein